MKDLATKEVVKDIVETLDMYHKKITSINTSHDREEFFNLMGDLDRYITGIIDEDAFQSFYHSVHFRTFSDLFLIPHQYYMRAVEALESSCIQRVSFSDSIEPLSDKVKGDFMKTRFYTKVKDLSMVDFSRVKKFVMVGTGPLPDTILFVTENFNIPEIIGIDNNAEAVFSGNELIRYLGLSQVQIRNADGIDYDYSGADLVYVANFVPPKNKVLSRIAETAPNHVQIIIESPLLMGRLFFEEVIPEKLHHLLRIQEKQVNETEFFRHEVLKIGKYPEI
ncbi:hypothetical protein IPN35_02610 [Candidatus Peregrinibacteria bacterium]|nr:MAG: hypothetical protein IPN35_02610 [Candidatus Peregrinibacteria bacterium]